MDSLLQYRIVRAIGAVLVAVTVGTFGFWTLIDRQASLFDCFYMTIITLSTVGYGEVIPMNQASRMFASALIVFGMGSLVYFGSTVIAFWVELDLQQVRRRKKMQKTISDMEKHVIVCGVGTTGSRVVHELMAARIPFIMVENRIERIEELKSQFADEGIVDETRIPFIHGDSTEDRVLHEAGIERASGLVASLPSDKDNLYIILSARQINPQLRIIARATERDAPPKMVHAGADRVVSPNMIGGLRIASELIRPQVVEFLDQMMRDQDQATRIEQVFVPADSPLCGKKLADTNIRKATDVLVIAIRDKSGKYLYNPGSDAVLGEESTLVVLGSVDAVLKLRTAVTGRAHSLSLIPGDFQNNLR